VELIIWDRDNSVGEGLIFERGTIYWEWDYLFGEGLFTSDRDNLVGEGLIMWSGTIYLERE
jgi:hypothetical protein